jgi:hypothetical protein
LDEQKQTDCTFDLYRPPQGSYKYRKENVRTLSGLQRKEGSKITKKVLGLQQEPLKPLKSLESVNEIAAIVHTHKPLISDTPHTHKPLILDLSTETKNNPPTEFINPSEKKLKSALKTPGISTPAKKVIFGLDANQRFEFKERPLETPTHRASIFSKPLRNVRSQLNSPLTKITKSPLKTRMDISDRVIQTVGKLLLEAQNP